MRATSQAREVSAPSPPGVPRPVPVRVSAWRPVQVDGERVQELVEDWLV
jgi:hypothetical protein